MVTKRFLFVAVLRENRILKLLFLVNLFRAEVENSSLCNKCILEILRLRLARLNFALVKRTLYAKLILKVSENRRGRCNKKIVRQHQVITSENVFMLNVKWLKQCFGQWHAGKKSLINFSKWLKKRNFCCCFDKRTKLDVYCRRAIF